MIVYLDNDFKCHIANDGTMKEFETDFFEGKCDTFIEGYRIVPEGETWIREDGEPFSGTMISPWRDYGLLEEFQAQHEKTLNEAQEAYDSGVNSI